ncbi:MAG TPA: LysM peptidoglycan-binding domain-containing protein [Terracidiphilus sp.]|nr:LysM peptidoglycan-binding domain-containing protein [Terracidiphilus sp.]
MSGKRVVFTGCLVLAIALAGCGPEKPVKSPVAASPQATAPPLAPAAPMKPAAPQPSVTENERVSQLIRQVEAAYASGEADYKRGNLPAAKVQFDHAVDMMMMSGIDINATPRLHDEFERVVDKVNALEMQALKQGNGFVAQVEPTPADVANDVTFKVDPNFEARARADLATTKSDLPLVMNDYVASFINFFANTERGHNTLLHAFERAGRYKKMIEHDLAEEGVPQDLIYLAVAESGFQPRAVNRRSRAGGMWQFMPVGDYGLERNRYVDERFDPDKSTIAYARYMKYLHDQLGDWYLAMAAYDHGAGNIQRAVARTGYASFWELYKRGELPTETRNYVPEIIAAIIIANHPKQYGFNEITLDPQLVADDVTVNYSVSLRLVSDIVNAPVDELQALNPSLLRGETPPDSSFDLHLPAGTAGIFEQRIAQIPMGRRDSWRYHVVSEGDTLASVAREYHVSLTDLAAANELGDDSSIGGMEALVIPERPQRERYYEGGDFYRVRRGDTLITVADRFGVSLTDLRRWNHLRGNLIAAGRRLRVTAPEGTYNGPSTRSSSERASSRPSTASLVADPPTRFVPVRSVHSKAYRVRRGDTLGTIAAHFGVSTAELRRWNHIRGNLIHVGAVLLVTAPSRN